MTCYRSLKFTVKFITFTLCWASTFFQFINIMFKMSKGTIEQLSEAAVWKCSLIVSWQKSISYRNQSIYLFCKSMGWFLYDRDLRHKRVEAAVLKNFVRHKKYLRLCAFSEKRTTTDVCSCKLHKFLQLHYRAPANNYFSSYTKMNIIHDFSVFQLKCVETRQTWGSLEFNLYSISRYYTQNWKNGF